MKFCRKDNQWINFEGCTTVAIAIDRAEYLSTNDNDDNCTFKVEAIEKYVP